MYIAGFISDKTGSYTLTFITAGIGILMSGAMLFTIPCLRKYDSTLSGSSDSLSSREVSEVSSSRDSPRQVTPNPSHVSLSHKELHQYSSMPEIAATYEETPI